MYYPGQNETDGEGKDKDHFYCVDESWNFGEGEFINSDFPKSHNQTAQLRRESSPPLLLTFPIASQMTQDDTSSVSSYDSQEEQGEEESDQPIEEWMILGGEEQEEDSSIQLNLAYWDDSEDNDKTNQNVKSISDIWAVSDKDKYGTAQPLATRYFVLGRSSICNICNKTGHFAKNCSSQKKCPVCVLCGIQGHIQRDCQGRPCPKCGLPPHGLGPCRVPSVWKQHCQRCGMTGHLSDACPDTWRQYHLTVKLEVPFRPRNVCSLRHKKRRAHCYNCSKRGHYGFECINRRMVSGTFPSLPYVIHYDTQEDILYRGTRVDGLAKRDKELVNAGSLHKERLFEKTEDCGEKWKSKKKQEAGGRRKTWPERRRERREVKRLRREAQAKREGGLLGRSWCKSDDKVCFTNRFRHNLCGCGLFLPPSEKKIRVEKDAKKSRKNREAERWKKRGGIKCGDLYPHPDMDIGSENFLSPKQRVRHRRR